MENKLKKFTGKKTDFHEIFPFRHPRKKHY